MWLIVLCSRHGTPQTLYKIDEQRALTTKYDELKLESVFIRSTPDFYKTDWVGDTSTGDISASSPDIYVTLLRNPETQSCFYILRHNDSSST